MKTLLKTLTIIIGKECGLKHAQVIVSYYKNQELLMGEEWFVEF